MRFVRCKTTSGYGPEVSVLYLKRPRMKIYHSDALCTGASDTALRLPVTHPIWKEYECKSPNVP